MGNMSAEYYRNYAARRRELDKARRSTPEGRQEQSRLAKERRSALKRATMMSEWDIFVREEAKALCKHREKETGIPWEPDHMIPLRARKVSGLNCGDNIQVIPAYMNRSKKNNMLWTNRYEWLEHIKNNPA